MDNKLKSFGGNQKGRIILLGDGTEVLTDSDDTEMFDHGDEDKDLDSQVHKGQVTGHDTTKTDALPEKIDSSKPEYKAVAEKVLSNSTESTQKKSDDTPTDASAK
jgi:protein phosphatase 2C family protein 2/3